MSETSIYIVDDQYRIVYFNKNLKKIYPDIKNGDICYRVLCHENEPCERCGIHGENGEDTLFFNKWIQEWVEVSYDKAEWPEHGELNIVIAKPFGMNGKERFFQAASRYLREHEDINCSLVAIDIDQFKFFNKWYGRHTGDVLLRDLANQLKQIAHFYEGITGYFHNDDFCMLLPGGRELVEKLKLDLDRELQKDADYAGLHISYGVYETGKEEQELSMGEMYDRALIALHSVKGCYIKNCGYFHPEMLIEMEGHRRYLSTIRKAIENGEIYFCIQPQCELSTGKMVGGEALVRWKQGDTEIPPDRFLPTLEVSGFIPILDQYIWECVCKWLSGWKESGGNTVPVSVNVSQVDILHLDIPDVFCTLTEKYHLDPGMLKLEITETAYMQDFGKVYDTVQRLHELGFMIFMDDFGRGYSSLHTLKDLSIDVIKLDTSFMEMDEMNLNKGIGILKSMLDLANSVGVPVVVEGVQNLRQAEILQEIGYRYGQGFGFYRAMTTNAFEELLSDPNRLAKSGIW